MVSRRSLFVLAAGASLFALAACNEPEPGTVKDEAMRAGRTAASFPAADEDYFEDMDGGYKRASDASVKLDVNEVRGRNTWIVWTGGNDRFWDYMANNTFGAFDLLKIVSSNPRVGYCKDPDEKKPDYGNNYVKYRYDYDESKSYLVSKYSELTEAECKKGGFEWYTPNRSNRFYWYGLVNEPCFEQATGPDEYGLWLDRRKKDCPARSVRGRNKISRRQDRRAGHHRSGRLVLRQGERHCRLAAVPQSRFRRGGQAKMGSGDQEKSGCVL